MNDSETAIECSFCENIPDALLELFEWCLDRRDIPTCLEIRRLICDEYEVKPSRFTSLVQSNCWVCNLLHLPEEVEETIYPEEIQSPKKKEKQD